MPFYTHLQQWPPARGACGAGPVPAPAALSRRAPPRRAPRTPFPGHAAPSSPGEFFCRPPRRTEEKKRSARRGGKPMESGGAARGTAETLPCGAAAAPRERDSLRGTRNGTRPQRPGERPPAASRRLTLGEHVQHSRLLQVLAELLPLGVRGLREDAHTVRSAARPASTAEAAL